MKNLKEAEEKILDSALALIAERGSFNITVRELAKRADVNVAAINYYFKTKDNMLEWVKKFYIRNTIQAYSPLEDDELNTREKLEEFANNIIIYSLKYPGIINLLKEIYENKEGDQAFKDIVGLSRELNKKLDLLIREQLGKIGEREFEFKKSIFLSSIVYPSSFGNIMQLDEEVMTDPVIRGEYIDYLLRLLGI